VIDFVSTRPGVDPETRACARLIGSVIAHAVQDMCRAPTSDEKTKSRNLDPEARAAAWFLFGTRSTFGCYAGLIGADASTMREALMSYEPSRHGSGLGEIERRILRMRARWLYAAELAGEVFEPAEEAEETEEL
jgi:hypothetical protein